MLAILRDMSVADTEIISQINIEVKLDIQFIDNLKEFVSHLTKRMHAAVPGSLVIWYFLLRDKHY